MLGLKRGTVQLLPHQPDWDTAAEQTIVLLKKLLAHAAVDVQHVGSTAVRGIHAKPILDIAVGVRSLGDVKPYLEPLAENGIVFSGEDIPGQLLFVMGDFERDTRTHHIHVVEWNGAAWNDYIGFRNYLNTFPDKAEQYDKLKQRLAAEFAGDRAGYTKGKQKLIQQLLMEASALQMYPESQQPI